MEIGSGAVVFMIVTWTSVIALNVYCFVKIFKK